MKNVIGIVVSYVFIIVVILLAKIVEKKGKEASRKFIHIILSNWWFIAMYFFDHVIWASIVPLSFVLINYVSYQKDWIKVMEREEKQKNLGTVYYAISLFILCIISFGILKDPRIGLVGILVMGYGDGLAALIGQTIQSKEYKIGKNTKKTIAGSITMFCVTAILISFFLIHTPFWYLKVVIASLAITLLEAVSIKGTDNLTVPIMTSLIVAVLQ